MLLTARQLLHLAVVTRSNVSLGHISGFAFEVDSQSILEYEVRRVPLVGSPLLIARDQVISITAKQMVVLDAVVGAKESSHLFPINVPDLETTPLSQGGN